MNPEIFLWTRFIGEFWSFKVGVKTTHSLYTVSTNYITHFGFRVNFCSKNNMSDRKLYNGYSLSFVTYGWGVTIIDDSIIMRLLWYFPGDLFMRALLDSHKKSGFHIYLYNVFCNNTIYLTRIWGLFCYIPRCLQPRRTARRRGRQFKSFYVFSLKHNLFYIY